MTQTQIPNLRVKYTRERGDVFKLLSITPEAKWQKISHSLRSRLTRVREGEMFQTEMKPSLPET